MNKINKKRNIIIVLLLFISIGFAYLSTTLNITGTSILRNNKWEVIWDDTSVVEESTNITATLPTVDNNKTTVTYNVTLNNPGDYYEFSLDAFNNGTIDAMVSLITFSYKENNTTVSLPSVIKHTVKYADGSDIAVKDLLPAGQKQKYYINIEYDRNVTTSNMISTNRSFSVTIKIDYEQADNTAVAKVINSNTLCPNNKHQEITSKIVCKRATNLHTEKCLNEETTGYCQAAGYELNEDIIYGTCGTFGTLTAGDAFDCDVDGNGTYDDDERFYYVSPKDADESSDYATFIYYKSVGIANYNEDNSNHNGPVSALPSLPSNSEWNKVPLSNTRRKIKNELNEDKVGQQGENVYTINEFEYANKAARLLTFQELSKGCNYLSYSDMSLAESLDSCQYFLEKTAFSNNGLNAWWLETPSHYINNYVTYIESQNRRMYLYKAQYDMGVRPAIEVPLKNISY